jgi:hypothetical protein
MDNDTKALAQALREVLAAIRNAQIAGCIEHLDAWDEVAEQWDKPIERARGLLLRVDPA